MASKVVKHTGLGRRKTAIVRVSLKPGTGKISINKRPFEEYFSRETDRIIVLTPFRIANLLGKFEVEIITTGGGLTGQAGAIKMGIARALTSFDAATRPVLKKSLTLRRDSRMKERKKPGQKGARRKFQWVKR